MSTWADLEALGYTVADSAPGVKVVSGNGLLTYIAENDQEQIDSLADPVLHAERIAPPEDTIAATTAAPDTAAPAQLAQLNPSTATLADVIAAVNALIPG